MEEVGLWNEAVEGGGSHTKYVSPSSRGKHQQSFNLEPRQISLSFQIFKLTFLATSTPKQSIPSLKFTCDLLDRNHFNSFLIYLDYKMVFVLICLLPLCQNTTHWVN